MGADMDARSEIRRETYYNIILYTIRILYTALAVIAG